MENWGFWAAALIVAGAVAAGLLSALRRDRRVAAPAAQDIAVYRDQLAEIERDAARGTLAADEAQRLRAEVGRRILDADRAEAAAPPEASARGSAALPAALMVSALVAGVAGYAWLGAPGYPDLPIQERLADAAARMENRPSQAEAVAALPPPLPPTGVAPDFMDLMEKLRVAVAERPDDLRGLELLSRNEAALGNFIAAEAAQRRVIEAKGEAATGDDYAALAEILIAAAGGYVSPEAEAVLVAALAREPGNALARYFSGLMFAQGGRFDRAFTLWEALLRDSPADAPWIAPIRERLEDVAWRAGVNYQLPEAPGPDAADIAAAGEMAEADRQAMIEGMVAQLSDRLASDGGSVEEWSQLIRALVVLERRDEAQVIYDESKVNFAGRTTELSFLRLAAVETGLTP